MDYQTLANATGCALDKAASFAGAITKACDRWHITTPDRQAVFLAQIAHESALFTRLEEGLNYTTPERLCKMFGSKFRMPQAGESGLVVFPDGKRNPLMFLNRPQALANVVYSNRYGNGAESTGDGYRYRGMGLIQLTFKANVERYAEASGRPEVIANPELLKQPELAADSAGWYFDTHNCNELADFGLFEKVTATINSALEGLDLRKALWYKARAALGLTKFNS